MADQRVPVTTDRSPWLGEAGRRIGSLASADRVTVSEPNASDFPVSRLHTIHASETLAIPSICALQ